MDLAPSPPPEDLRRSLAVTYEIVDFDILTPGDQTDGRLHLQLITARKP